MAGIQFGGRDDLMLLACSVAARVISRGRGISPDEAQGLQDEAESIVRNLESTACGRLSRELDVLGTKPQADEDRERVQFVLALSAFADIGAQAAAKVLVRRATQLN